MHQIVKAFFLIVFFALSFNEAFAQNGIELNNFSGSAQADQVQLRWVISAGQTCNGTFIERSADRLAWEQIGEIPGVCGNSSAAVPYTFVDEFPFKNTINYYRLELGGQGYSPVIGIPYYDYMQKDYVIIPNPAYQNATFYFGTSATEKFRILIFSASGILVHQATGAGSSYSFNVTGLVSGAYIFNITRSGFKDISGKLLVR